MVERFNKTLLNMIGTFSETKSSDWKAHVSTLTLTYNSAVHVSAGFSTYYLMFSGQSRLAIDSFLGLHSNNIVSKSKPDYSHCDKLKDQLYRQQRSQACSR